ncbi:MAG: galactitol-1-phosphate 5-dehydrogenase [Thermoplasmata archaeon]|nr:galactitol-1-phosphate 5-dehydrogenase [Thermoplasmata archaeon]
MKAAVWYGGKDIRIEDLPTPKIKDDEVLVRVKAVSICGSDLHAYRGASKRRIPPLVMGHEFSGEIVKLGRTVKGLKEGERVVLEPVLSCGKCALCQRGRSNICENIRLVGLHLSGAFSEYVPIPASKCHTLPDAVSFEEASLVEPLAVAVHAVNFASLEKDEDIGILGSGAVGLMTLQVVNNIGAEKLFAIDTLEYRLDLAKKLGATTTINAKKEDPVKEVLAYGGANTVFEAVGHQKTVQQALSMVKKGGKVVIIGMLEATMELGMLDVTVKEIEIKGSYGYTSNDFKQALTLIAKGKVEVKPLITHVLSLHDIVKGFDILSQGAENVIKVVLKP